MSTPDPVHDRETESPERPRGYRAVAEVLRARILAGSVPGGRLPAEEALATEFGVARDTVRRALAVLVEGGLIRSTHGRGHFVVGGNDESSAGVPRYLIVAQAIRDRISDGRLQHDMMPSEAEVQAEFDVSRNTARRAFAQLETWGLVERRGPRRYARPTER